MYHIRCLREITVAYSQIDSKLGYNFSGFSEHEFHSDLRKHNFLEILNENDTNSAYQMFANKFKSACSKYKIDLNPTSRSKIKKPWITRGIINSIKARDKLYARTIRNPNNEYLRDEYKHYCKQLRKVIRRARRVYFHKKIENCQGNNYKTWQTIYEAINKQKNQKHNIPRALNIEGTQVDDKQTMCEQFNNYFTRIGDSIAQQIPSVINTCAQPEPNSNTFFASPVTESEVRTLVKQLSERKAMGHDGIHPKLLKASEDSVIKALTHIFNLSLQNGVFPIDLKTARVLPIHKGGPSETLNNYRPISLLPILSKILEKLMHSRVYKFLEEQNFFYQYQYGFRKNKNTGLAIAELTNELNINIDNGLINVGVFLDFRKAFDTVDHTLLLKKLDTAGIRGIINNWFDSYLKYRKQYVQLGDEVSPHQMITRGVPQGSILGPLLFLIYINDINKAVLHGSLRLFADDANLFYNGRDIDTLQQKIEEDLSRLGQWLCNNKLSINFEKCNFMYICSQQRKPYLPKMNVQILNRQINYTNCYKYLGVIIDESLTFKQHITAVCKSLSPLIGVFARARHVLPRTVLRLIYFSLFHSKVQYCLEAWGATAPSILLPLLVMQRKIIRIMTFSGYRDDTVPMFRSLNVLTIPQLYQLRLAIMVFNELNGNSCSYFGFTPLRHSYGTRQRESGQLDLRPSTHSYNLKTNYAFRSIIYEGTRVFNNIPDNIKTAPSIHVFKKKCKSWLIINAY